MSKRPEWWLSVLAKIWPITWTSAKATNLPVVGPIIAKIALPLFTGNNLNITYIPINRPVNGAGSSLLPLKVVEELIRRSSYQAIIKRCTCRDARQCKEHPIDYGCLFLGEGAREIDPRIARHVKKEEAVDHLHRCVEDGLVPMAGRVKIDNLIWGVPDRGNLLTICFCCHCCCTLLTSGRYLPQDALDSFVPLRGLRITVDAERCVGCGLCVEECHMGAIALDGGRIVHDELKCKGCGRCVLVCPEKAVNAEVENLDEAMEELIGRIAGMINIGQI